MRIERITEARADLLIYVEHKYRTLPEFKDFNLSDVAIARMLKYCDIYAAYEDFRVVGIMVTYYGRNFLDDKIKTLTLEAIASDSPRATKMLLELFIDMGKKYADHLIMSKGVSTNLKSSTLIKLGFKPLETVYKLEV